MIHLLGYVTLLDYTLWQHLANHIVFYVFQRLCKEIFSYLWSQVDPSEFLGDLPIRIGTWLMINMCQFTCESLPDPLSVTNQREMSAATVLCNTQGTLQLWHDSASSFTDSEPCLCKLNDSLMSRCFFCFFFKDNAYHAHTNNSREVPFVSMTPSQWAISIQILSLFWFPWCLVYTTQDTCQKAALSTTLIREYQSLFRDWQRKTLILGHISCIMYSVVNSSGRSSRPGGPTPDLGNQHSRVPRVKNPHKYRGNMQRSCLSGIRTQDFLPVRQRCSNESIHHVHVIFRYISD